jgi:hypothetical protein
MKNEVENEKEKMNNRRHNMRGIPRKMRVVKEKTN